MFLKHVHDVPLTILQNQKESSSHALLQYNPHHESLLRLTDSGLEELDVWTGANWCRIGAHLTEKEDAFVHISVSKCLVAATTQKGMLYVFDLNEIKLAYVGRIVITSPAAGNAKSPPRISALATIHKGNDGFILYTVHTSGIIHYTNVDALLHQEPPFTIKCTGFSHKQTHIVSLACSQKSLVIAAGASDGSIHMFDYSSMSQNLDEMFKEDNVDEKDLECHVGSNGINFSFLQTLHAIQSPVLKMAFSRSTKKDIRLAVCYGDCTVEVWEIPSFAIPLVRPQYRTRVHPIDAQQKSWKVHSLMFLSEPSNYIILANACSASKKHSIDCIDFERQVCHKIDPSLHSDQPIVLYEYSMLHTFEHHGKPFAGVSSTKGITFFVVEGWANENISSWFTQLSTKHPLSFVDLLTSRAEGSEAPHFFQLKSTASKHGGLDTYSYSLYKYNMRICQSVEEINLPMPVGCIDASPWKLLISPLGTHVAVLWKNTSTTAPHEESDNFLIQRIITPRSNEKDDHNLEDSSTIYGKAGDMCFLTPTAKVTVEGKNSFDGDTDYDGGKFSYVVALDVHGKEILLYQMSSAQPQTFLRMKWESPLRILRLFTTPIMSASQSTFQGSFQAVLLYLVQVSESVHRLQYSRNYRDASFKDNLSIEECPAQDILYMPVEEQILQLEWCPDYGKEPFGSMSALQVIAEYNYAHRSEKESMRLEPVSFLWIGLGILILTKRQQCFWMSGSLQLRYITSLNMDSRLAPQKTQLVAIYPDRFYYTQLFDNGVEKTLVHPFSSMEVMIQSILDAGEKRDKLDAVQLDTVLQIIRMHQLREERTQSTGQAQYISSDLYNYLLKHGLEQLAYELLRRGDARDTKYLLYDFQVSPRLASEIAFRVHDWKSSVDFVLGADPSLQRYAMSPFTNEATKLPSRDMELGRQLENLGHSLELRRQLGEAMRCYDLVGDDAALFRLGLKCRPQSKELLHYLDVGKRMKTVMETTSRDDESKGCSKGLGYERRTTLLPETVTPLPNVNSNHGFAKPWNEVNDVKGKAAIVIAAVNETMLFPPFEADNINEWFGTPFPYLAVAHDAAVSNLKEMSLKSNGEEAQVAETAAVTEPNIITRFGPFINEEDALVGYWRFEDGVKFVQESNLRNTHHTLLNSTIEDLSKYKNRGIIFGPNELICPTYVKSSAPMERGDEMRVLEEYAIQYPLKFKKVSGEGKETLGSWGIRSTLLRGGSNDLAMCLGDENEPSHRQMTVELLARSVEQDWPCSISPSSASPTSPTPSSTRNEEEFVLMERRTGTSTVWKLFIQKAHLVFQVGESTTFNRVTSLESIDDVTQWHHYAVTVNVLDHEKLESKLFINGLEAGSSVSLETVPKSKLYSSDATGELILGPNLTSYEITEVRMWAIIRSSTQLIDYQDTYLELAETKKKFKINIHPKDCPCMNCMTRREKSTLEVDRPSIVAPASPWLRKPPTKSSSQLRLQPSLQQNTRRPSNQAGDSTKTTHELETPCTLNGVSKNPCMASESQSERKVVSIRGPAQLVQNGIRALEEGNFDESRLQFEAVIEILGKSYMTEPKESLKAKLGLCVRYVVALQMLLRLQSDQHLEVPVPILWALLCDISLQPRHVMKHYLLASENARSIGNLKTLTIYLEKIEELREKHAILKNEGAFQEQYERLVNCNKDANHESMQDAACYTRHCPHCNNTLETMENQCGSCGQGIKFCYQTYALLTAHQLGYCSLCGAIYSLKAVKAMETMLCAFCCVGTLHVQDIPTDVPITN